MADMELMNGYSNCWWEKKHQVQVSSSVEPTSMSVLRRLHSVAGTGQRVTRVNFAAAMGLSHSLKSQPVI